MKCEATVRREDYAPTAQTHGHEAEATNAPEGPSESACGIGMEIAASASTPSVLPLALAEWMGSAAEAPGALFVIQLDPGGAAALSGQVQAGDELLAVDRQKAADLTAQEVAEKLQGPQGSLIKLRLRRNNITFDVCMQREPVRQAPPMRKTRTLNPVPRREDGAAEVLEKLYRGFAKINSAREVRTEAKMTPEETKAFHAAQDAEVKRQESIAKRCIDATKRRHAETCVLQVVHSPLRNLTRNPRDPHLFPSPSSSQQLSYYPFSLFDSYSRHCYESSLIDACYGHAEGVERDGEARCSFQPDP